MTYRDERLILRERLGEMLTEAARLSGRVAGLQAAIAEADDRCLQAEAQLRTVPIRRRFKKVAALLVGVGGIAGACVLCALGALALKACDPMHRTFTADVLGGSEEPRSCRIVVDEVDTESCHALVECGSTRRYDGTASCREVSGDGLEVWDEVDGTDGTPALVVSETLAAAAVRDGDTVLRLSLDLPGGR